MFRKMIGATLAASCALAALAAPAFADADTPVVFVHGDSDTSDRWTVQIWRFESNGWPRERLFAVDIPSPGARGDDGVYEVNRSSTADAAAALAGEVTRALIATGADKVALVGNSRGCQTIRNYLKNGGGAAHVETAVLTGCVHHGVFNNPGGSLGSEYNGQGGFLKQLNDGAEVIEGVKTVTIRSDKLDLYNQPMGDWIGLPGTPIGGSFEGPMLAGADNRMLEGVDHRETGFSPAAFAIEYEAVAGKPPATLDVTPEAAPEISGKVTGWANDRPTNLPLEGAKLTAWETDAATGARMGEPVLTQEIDMHGGWGPMTAKPDATYEFMIEAAGYPPHHIYRGGFLRGSRFVNLRLYPSEAKDRTAPAVGMMRPRGYMGAQRDLIELGGQTAPGVPDTEVPGVWKITVPAEAGAPVVGRFRDETRTARAWPADHVVWIELTN